MMLMMENQSNDGGNEESERGEGIVIDRDRLPYLCSLDGYDDQQQC